MTTLASPQFIAYVAEQTAKAEPVVFDEIIFAQIPNLTATNLNEHLNIPTGSKLKHRQAVSQVGYVNNNTVVYSVTLGTEVGDFDFNFIGLINRNKNLLAVGVYTDSIRKLKNKSGQQGNAITRSICLEFSNAKQLTQINIPAQSWQIDFTARLSGIDEDLRLANLDIYGDQAFLSDGFKITKQRDGLYEVASGVGYVKGLRAFQQNATPLTINRLPTGVYLDVSHAGTVTSDFQTAIELGIVEKQDYRDSAGVMHYVAKIADIDEQGNVTDLRLKPKFEKHKHNKEDIEGLGDELNLKSIKTEARLDFGKVPPTNIRNNYNFDDIREGDYLFYNRNSSSAVNPPPFQLATVYAELSYGTNGNQLIATAIDYTTGNRASRAKYNGRWQNWVTNLTKEELSSAVDSESTSTPANSKAVKTAYERAVAAEGKGLPVGAVVAFPRAITNPQGFLKCDGSTFHQETYPDLYAALGNKNRLPDLRRSDVGMTSYFATDNIPDGWIAFDSIRTQVTQAAYPELYRFLTQKYGSIASVPLAGDRYIRNAGGNLSVGATQEDAIRNITGKVGQLNDRANRQTSGVFNVESYGSSAGLEGGYNGYTLHFDASRVVPTADENRPKTLVLKLCIKAKNSLDDVQFWIKAFGAVNNAGVMDASQLGLAIQEVRSEKADKNHIHTAGQISDFNLKVNQLINEATTYQKVGNIEITKLPDGTMIQRSHNTEYLQDGYKQVTFPLAFIEPPQVVSTARINGAYSGEGVVSSHVGGITNTHFYMGVSENRSNAGGAHWIAIGRWK